MCDEDRGVCEPGEPACTSDDDCAAGEVCASGRCEAATCSDDRGAEEVVSSCGGGAFCDAGVCLARVCEDGERTCVRGSVYACDELGSGFELETRCGSGQICREGACVEDGGFCESSADCGARPASCEGDVLVRTLGSGSCVLGVCDYSGVTRRQDCAMSDRVCDEELGACVEADESCGGEAPCSGGDVCVDGACVECGTDADCPFGETC